MWRRALGAGVALALATGVAGAAGAGEKPQGDYRTQITRGPAQLKGTWHLTFGPKGAYSVFKGTPTPTHRVVGGTLTYSGRRITMTDLRGPLACAGEQAVGVYRFAIPTATTLRLTKVDDACAGRPLILAGHVFTKVPAAN